MDSTSLHFILSSLQAKKMQQNKLGLRASKSEKILQQN